MSKLSRNTERAISLISVEKDDPLLYWPSYLRTGSRVDINGLATTNPPDEKEQIARIVEADPEGFLIALMNGQPVPVLHVNEDYDSDAPPSATNQRYFIKPEIANLGMRRDIAQHLLSKLVPNKSRIERDRKAGKKRPGQDIFGKVMDHVNERAAPAKED